MERRASRTHLQAESPIAADKWGARTGSGWWAMRKAPPPQEQAFCLLLLAGKGEEARILQPSVSRWRVELSWYHHVSLKVTYRGGLYLETSGCINLTGIISSDSCLSASGQLMTHSIAQTLILLKKNFFLVLSLLKLSKSDRIIKTWWKGCWSQSGFQDATNLLLT